MSIQRSVIAALLMLVLAFCAFGQTATPWDDWGKRKDRLAEKLVECTSQAQNDQSVCDDLRTAYAHARLRFDMALNEGLGIKPGPLPPAAGDLAVRCPVHGELYVTQDEYTDFLGYSGALQDLTKALAHQLNPKQPDAPHRHYRIKCPICGRKSVVLRK